MVKFTGKSAWLFFYTLCQPNSSHVCWRFIGYQSTPILEGGIFVIISFNKIMIGHKLLAINLVHAGVRVTQEGPRGSFYSELTANSIYLSLTSVHKASFIILHSHSLLSLCISGMLRRSGPKTVTCIYSVVTSYTESMCFASPYQNSAKQHVSKNC